MAVIEPFPGTDRRASYASVRQVMHAGGIVAIPTETYYGLGVNPFDQAAVDRLIAIKGRPEDKPFLLVIGEPAQLHGLVARVPPAAQALMDAFWPGPLTIVFPADTRLPDNVTAGTGTIGVRLTSCEPLADLLQQVGPLTGTSANRSGAPALCTAAEVNRSLGNEVTLILDAGATPGGAPSSIVSVCDGLELLREGVIDRIRIQRILEARGFRLRTR
ncbi:L-threonylcarbamoyladenylate synthase [Nitrospira sp. NS4]|uniref:L-threonylcarbamoyladenylate synthase n=1 Tax=Nitrospira sp. NS4 TaxID=3414498 RepID=UPI003C3069D6